jgi:hypothetical protein
LRRLIEIIAFIGLTLASPAAFAQQTLEVPEGGYAVSDNLDFLPQAVREKREQLIAAAKSGDILQLKLIFDAEPAPPTVSYGDPDDPIAYLKSESADGEGIEILAILRNLLDAPYAAMDGGDGTLYIWPYLAVMEDLSKLTPDQLVDGYRVAGYETFNQQREYGGWLYWRVFMNERGELQAFVAGD